MDNPEKLGTQDTERRQTKQNKHIIVMINFILSC